MCALPQKKSFSDRIKLIANSLHQILGEVHRPPRQGMRSSADSLDKKRFIGEHRGEFKRRDGRGEARRTTAERTPAQTGEQQATHLAAWLSAKERNSRLLSVCYILMPTCTTCFKQETLLVSLFTVQRGWLHFI